jgi:Leucine-rich repeat (LRR) protein
MSTMKNTLFATLLFICISHLSFAQITASEYNALMDLYQSTNGANWTNKTGWSTANPAVVQSVQGWHGVTTDVNGHVTMLHLTNNNLTGTILASIGNLTYLTILSLEGNDISGSLPAELGSLASLSILKINDSNLTGSIPQTIGNLLQLKEIDLSNNQLSGAIPSTLCSLSSLEIVNFGANQLTGSIPSCIGNMTSLVRIGFHNNQLNGSIPSSIGNLSNLQVMWLQANQLSGSIPSEVGSLISLFNLALYNNQFSGALPQSMGNLTLLKHMDISNNQLSGEIFSSLGNLTLLTHLDLYNNQLTGAIPASVGNLTALQYINLGQNQLSGSIPSTIGNMTSLTNVNLYNNQLSGGIPSSIQNLINLRAIWMYNNQLSGSLPLEIGNLTQLYDIRLYNNQLSGPIPQSIGNLGLLKYIDLSNNQLNGQLPSSIGNLNKLEFFHVRTNQLTGSIPSTIGNMTAINNIAWDNNQLTGVIPSSIANLSNLQVLWLQSNQLIGNGDGLATLGSMGALSNIRLENNKLTFADFLQLRQQKSQLVYSPQALIDTEKTLQAPIGSPYTLTTTIDRNTTPASVYRWYKKVNGVITPLNEASVTGHTVELPAITQTDNGIQYYYTITNTAAPGLTLTSHLQTLAATTCQTPVLDFQFEEVNGTHTFNPSVSNADNCTITYSWDFGDGTSSQDQVGNHDYAAVGSYTVVLTVNYQCGACASSTLTKEYVVSITNNVLCQSIYCDGNGGVGIGTRKTQGFALSVNGKIRASDIIKVYPHNQWADFVFDRNYKLRPLNEVELFIKRNGHLPEIPSAAQVEKEGVELGAMDAKLLQKIEELTLYMIALKKENDQMRKELNTLKEKIKN